MRKLLTILLPPIFACLLVFSSCKKNGEGGRTIADVELDFKAFDLTPGIHDVTLELTDGASYQFRYIAPVRASTEKRPMVLALHGASAGNPEAYKNTACYVEPGLEILNAFIISPEGGNGLWYEDYYQEEVATLLYLAKKYWPVEIDKIAVTGYSNGGNGSWYFAETQYSSLSAAIPMASSYNILNPDNSARKMKIPLYVIHGEVDELFPIAQTQAWVQASQNAGSDITFVTATGLGHYVPCSYTPYLKNAAIWLRDVVWQ